MYWFVEGKGLVTGNVVPEGNAFPMDEQTFTHCRNNYELLDIYVKDGRLHVEIDMLAYRAAALARLTNVDYILHNGVKYCDDELMYMSADYVTRSGYPCELSVRQMIEKVTERNRSFANKRSGIISAQTPEEVEEFL